MANNSIGVNTYFNISQQKYDMCMQIVLNAQSAWGKMVQQFAAENIAMGITQAGKTRLIANALYEVSVYGSTGSLWLAYDALSKVKITPEMAPYLTEDRVQWMKNQMIQTIASL